MHNKILKFLVFIVLFFSTIERVNASELVKNAVKDVYYVRRGGEEKYFSAPFSEYSIDGMTTYCIEPGTRITSQDYIKKEGLIESPFDQVLTNKLELIGYYGYDYPTHKTVKYRMATQALIWEAISDDFIVDFWTEQYGHGDEINVDSEKDEIMNLVNNHYNLPNIPKEVNSTTGKSLELRDTTYILDQFEITNNGGQDAYIQNNVLYINNLKSGSSTITLTKKRYTNNISNLFVGENKKTQIMAYFGLSTPLTFNINLNVKGAGLWVEKTDMETRFEPQGDAELKGAVFNLYKENGDFVEEIVIDDSLITHNKLELDAGKYYLQEVKPGIGYELNPVKYYFDIYDEFLNIYISATNQVIKKELQLYKFLGDNVTGILQGESNITFEIYLKSSNELKYTVTTDKNGFASVILPYGTYVVKQINTTKGYEKVDDFEIVIDDNSDNVIQKFIYDKKDNYKIIINKIDAETKELINIDGIKFKLKNLDNNEYICQNNNCIYETKNGTIMINNLSSGNYQLEEIENQVIFGYLWNSKPLKFSLNDNTHYDEENGTKIVQINFENYPIKGQINIKKYGENIVYQDNTFFYQYELLDNVEYTLFADDDIYYNGKLIYKKDDIVGIYKTVYGEVEINNLYLGKYYLKETKTLNNYIIDDKIYKLNLENKNQYVDVVKENFEFRNNLNKGNLLILKKDKDTNKPLSNVLIEIHDKNNDNIIFKGRTDDKGKVLIKDLYYGEFYILEIETEEGYVLLNESIEFQINDSNILNIEIDNEKIKGTLHFFKKDKESFTPLSNVEINILDQSNNIIYDGITNENGEIIVENLPYGKYYIVEVKTLDGYILYDGKLEFEIKEDKEVINLDMFNEKIKGTLHFFKKDKESFAPLSNVEINILDQSNNIIYNGITNENGEIIVEDLPYGKYYIVEVKTLDDYILYNGKLEFEIKEDKEVINLEMFNEKEPIIKTFEVPKTFSNNKKIYYSSLLTYAIVGLYLIYYGKKDKC